MFYKILFFILLSTIIHGGEIVWSSGASQSVSDAEYNRVISEYVAQKYPKELKVWEKKEIEFKSVALGKPMWQDDEAWDVL